MQSYRERLITIAASMAINILATQAVAKTEEARREHKQMGAKLLTTAATLERGFQSYRASGNLPVFRPQLDELPRLYQQWLSDLTAFKASLRAQGAEPWVLENVAMAFDQMAERIERRAR
ncbi:MAG: hypothetical protein RBS35_07550 [Azonexus sp.]|jgi:hypothetical protein|nr:hypothetical protein [Azonexus sp.]